MTLEAIGEIFINKGRIDKYKRKAIRKLRRITQMVYSH
jgi:DNA-directed RNA polymerase sigma subunit (sigma70/sigma32)